MRGDSVDWGTDVNNAKHSEHHQFCSMMLVFLVRVVNQ
jgi:hypothetical protein